MIALVFVILRKILDAVLLHSGTFYVSLENSTPAADAVRKWY